MLRQLRSEDFHVMKLISLAGDDAGWAKVNEKLFPVLQKSIPSELVEFDQERGARLTEEGVAVLKIKRRWFTEPGKE